MQVASPEVIVCETLRAATDSNHEVVRKAEVQLASWELQPGFFPTLTRLCLVIDAQSAAALQADINVRWMAAVYVKNGINKYWRRGTRQELSMVEKQQIRELLLQHFASETVPQVAAQVAVLVARIARIDCPRDWPELVPELLKRLQASTKDDCVDGVQQQRLLLVLHHVIKALASRRMMAEKRVFEELSGNIFVFVQDLWDGLTELFFLQLKSSPAICGVTLERSLLALRVLRKLTIYGFAKPHKSDNCMHAIEQIFARLKQCIQCRFELQQLNAEEFLTSLLEKFILKQMKTLNEFQNIHSESFTRFVPAALEFSFNYVFHEGAQLIFTNNIINFPQFAIHCINLMKGIMMCSVYSPPTNSADIVSSIVLADFFTNERLCYICEKIITYYFLLTQMELDQWAEDPECFAQDDGGESWRYALRPCVESLYLTCFAQYQSQMTAEVAKYIRKAQQIQLDATSDLKDILMKDAIYNAAGLASYHFFSDIDFDSWFSGQLLTELRINTDNFRILRRRIILLVAQWSSVKFSRNLRPLAYEACLHLLRQTEDMSTRLAATHALHNLISDFDFAPDEFLPYLEGAFNSLFILLSEAKECETKMNVLTNMSVIVEKMGDNIEPQAEKLIAYLPLLWKESEDYNMLRGAIISTLQQIVKVIRDIPHQMKPFLFSVIQPSTDLQEPSHIYLIEEGLSLWVALVENSTVMSPELMGLCKNLLPIIEMSSENMRTVLVLIQAYILLDARGYLDRYGRQFVDFCIRMFDDTRPEGIVLMLKVFEVCLKVDPEYGLDLVRPALPYIFKHVYLNREFPMLMSMYLTIVARVLLINQSTFTAVLQDLNLPNALETILDVWIEKMPLVTEVEKRKLFCLALGSILMNNTIVTDRFAAIIQNFSATLVEVMREEDDGEDGEGDRKIKYCDCLVFLDENDLITTNYCSMDDFEYKTYHYDRCRQLSFKDPVHNIVLPDYITSQLNWLRSQIGNDGYQRLLQTVDTDVLNKMSEFVMVDGNVQAN